MDESLPKRKPNPRLKIFNYKGHYAYSITICTHNKTPIFKSKEIVDSVLDVLNNVAEKEQFGILVYCFMPDHLHFLLAGGDRSNLQKMIKTFKQISSYRFKKSYGRPLWQRGYFDHVLRKDEDMEKVACYIWGNPVRKGLVSIIEDYPFSGPRENMDIGLT